MNVFHRSLLSRVHGFGGTPGDFNFAADILNLAEQEADSWTNRPDDASRIPDTLGEAARFLRRCSKDDDAE